MDAADGAILSAFTADVDFDVTDTAGNISAEVEGVSKFGNELDDANSVVVTSGTVDVSDAMAIQAISGYSDSSSDFDVSFSI